MFMFLAFSFLPSGLIVHHKSPWVCFIFGKTTITSLPVDCPLSTRSIQVGHVRFVSTNDTYPCPFVEKLRSGYILHHPSVPACTH